MVIQWLFHFIDEPHGALSPVFEGFGVKVHVDADAGKAGLRHIEVTAVFQLVFFAKKASYFASLTWAWSP